VRAWKKLGESPPQDFHIFKLSTLRVEHPQTGAPHPRVTLDCPDWVNVVAVTERDELVLIRQFRFGVWADTLEIPGGMLDLGEDPAAAAARELEEETGYRPAKLELLGVTLPNPAMQNNRLHHYLATGCVKAHEGAQDEGEDIEVELYPVAKVDELVRSGAIDHSLVIAAFYFWQRR
jgi:ADP-ribose pyrophosphatase